ncbi:MAG: hypothetical protein WBQ69_00860, partial [Gallionella sp.]
PLEYRENTDLLRAYLLSTGKNIYAYENLPSAHSQYGFLYPWLGSKLFSFTGIQFYPLRLITALAILPVLGLFIWQGVKTKIAMLDLFLLCGIVYASYLINTGNMLAMPNTLGLALFSLSVLAPPLLKFNKTSLVSSCAFSALGFFTKIYFGIGALYILLYLLLNKRWSDFRFMLLCLIATVITALVIIARLMPTFYETTIELSAILANWHLKTLSGQTIYFCRVFFVFILLIVTCKWLCPRYKIFSRENPYSLGLVLSIIILLKMGGNDGQFFVYFHHLLIPFLIPLSIGIIGEHNKKNIVTVLLFLNLLFVYSLCMRHNDLRDIERSFHELEIKTALLDPNAYLLYNAPTSYFAIKQKKLPNEQGQVEYLSASSGETHNRYLAQLDSIYENIRERKYRQIFIDELQLVKMAPLFECYSKSATFEIVMYTEIDKTEMWVPNSECHRNK